MKFRVHILIFNLKMINKTEKGKKLYKGTKINNNTLPYNRAQKFMVVERINETILRAYSLTSCTRMTPLIFFSF